MVKQALDGLDEVKGGMEKGESWDKDLPAKAVWSKLHAIVKATLRESEVAAELDVKVQDVKRLFVAYMALRETLGLPKDQESEKRWVHISTRAMTTYAIGKIVTIMETVTDKKQKREQINQVLNTIEDEVKMSEASALPKVLSAQIAKARSFA